MSGDELDPAAVAEMVEALRAVVPDDRVTSSADIGEDYLCLLYTSPSPRDRTRSRMPSSACIKKVRESPSPVPLLIVT